MRKSLLILICLCTWMVWGVERTTVVATRMGYPDLIIGLRNKAQNFLKDERVRMMVDVQGLRTEDLELRADELTNKYKEAYFDLEGNFDEVFEHLSEDFIRGANELDQDEASIAEKQQFIKQSEEKARRTVDEFLARNSAIMRNNPLNVDI